MLALQLAVFTVLLCKVAAITGVEGSDQPEEDCVNSSVNIYSPLHEDINSSQDEEDEAALQEDSHDTSPSVDYPVQHKREGGIILSDKETFSIPEKNGVNGHTGHELASLNEDRPGFAKFLRPMIYGPFSLDEGNVVNSHRRSDEGNVSSTMKTGTPTASSSRRETRQETTRTTVERSSRLASRSASHSTSTYTNKNQLNVLSTTELNFVKLKYGDENDRLSQLVDKSSSSLGRHDTVARIDSDKNEEYSRVSVDNFSKFHPELKPKASNVHSQFHDNVALLKDIPFEDEVNHASETIKFKSDRNKDEPTVLASDENFLSVMNSASRNLLENIVGSNRLVGEPSIMSFPKKNGEKNHHPFQRSDVSRVKVQWSGSIELEPVNSKSNENEISVHLHRHSNEGDEKETVAHSDSKRSNLKTDSISWKQSRFKNERDTKQKGRHRQRERGFNSKRAPLKQHAIRQIKPKQTELEQEDSTFISHGSRQERQPISDDIGTLTLPAQIQEFKKRHKMRKLFIPSHVARRKRVEMFKKRNNILCSENHQYAARTNREPHSNNDKIIRRSNNGLNQSMLRGPLPQKEYARSRKYIKIKAETDPQHPAVHRTTRTFNKSSEQSDIGSIPDQDSLPDAVRKLATGTPQPAAADFKVTPLFPMLAPEPESFYALINENVQNTEEFDQH